MRVQAVAATAGAKTVLAPPYNVLITGSTKGVQGARTGLDMHPLLPSRRFLAPASPLADTPPYPLERQD